MRFSYFLSDFWYFLGAPQAERPAVPLSFGQQVQVLAYALLTNYALMLLAVLPLGLLFGPELEERHRVKELMDESSPLVFLLTAAVMAPLLEETIFRLFLRYHLVNVLLSASLGAIFLLLALPATWLWLGLGGIGLCLLWLLFNLYRHSLPELYFQEWWHRRLPWLYFGSSLVFALVHLNNYNLPLGKSLFYAPVLVLPQFFIGLVLGYVRIRFSFGMAVLVHALHNGSLVLPILLFKELV